MEKNPERMSLPREGAPLPAVEMKQGKAAHAFAALHAALNRWKTVEKAPLITTPDRPAPQADRERRALSRAAYAYAVKWRKS